MENDKTKPQIDLPEGARKEETISRGVRWPKTLYSDLRRICHLAGGNVSVTSIVVSLTKPYVKEQLEKYANAK